MSKIFTYNDYQITIVEQDSSVLIKCYDTKTHKVYQNTFSEYCFGKNINNNNFFNSCSNINEIYCYDYNISICIMLDYTEKYLYLNLSDDFTYKKIAELEDDIKLLKNKIKLLENPKKNYFN
jgi:hypothetical protein